MRVVGLHHVQLAMPRGRESEAVAFYQGLLGIPEVAKPEHLQARGGCWFESGTVRVHLGVEDSFVPARKAHPALLVQDLAELEGELTVAGVTVEDDVPLTGYARVYAYDPFGNRIELLQPLGG